jgi:hypothetical protein
MKNIPTKRRKPSAGSRIIASLREAVDWAEGKDVSVRVTTNGPTLRQNLEATESHNSSTLAPQAGIRKNIAANIK